MAVIGETTRDSDLVSPLRDWGNESERQDARTCFYPIIVKNKAIEGIGNVCQDNYHPGSSNIKKKDGTIHVYPIDRNGVERKWVYNRDSAEKNRDQLFCKENNGEIVIMRRKSLFKYRTVWDDKKYYANIYGSGLLNRIIEEEFPFPKSVYNVKECLDAVAKDNKDSVILDFFAGSGTTAQAVFEINRRDDGNRQVILCTNNEGDICKKVCYPRVKKIIKGYKTDSNISALLFDKKLSFRDLSKTAEILEEINTIETKYSKSFDKYEVKLEDNTIRLFGVTNKENPVEGYGGNLKYFKTDFVPAQPTDRNKEKLTKQSVEMLCLKENTFEPVSDTDNIIIFKNNEKYTGILFDEQKIPEFKEKIKDFKKPVSVYIFSLGDDDFAEEFEELPHKVKVCSIPAAILRVYKRIFK